MKKMFFLFCIVSTLNSYAQLVPVTHNEFAQLKEGGRVFRQFNFKLKYDNSFYITSIQGDSVYYKPVKVVDFETFDSKFLLSTVIDRKVIPKGSSTLYCFYPRTKVCFIPIDSISISKYIYQVDFKKKIILEDLDVVMPGYRMPTESKYYKIKKIDFDNMKVTIVNMENHEITFKAKRIKR